MAVTIWHNPRCSKSRETLQLLRDRGIEPTIVEYLKSPPDATELDGVLTLLGLDPRQLMRTKEAAFKSAGLEDTALSRDSLIKAMVEHPILLERPVVLANDKAALGRSPEAVLAIL